MLCIDSLVSLEISGKDKKISESCGSKDYNTHKRRICIIEDLS